MGKIKEIFERRLVKSMLMITGGTAFGQALSFMFSPLITRIYTPEQYGVLTVYTSLLALFAGSQSLRYELGIPIADDDESAINVLALSITILILFSLVFSLLILFAGEFILSILSAEILFTYRMLIPLGFLTYGIYQIFMMWNFRKKSFQCISKTKIAQSISSNATKIGLGLLGLGPLGLIIGSIIGESSGITTLAKSLFLHEKSLIKKINIKTIFFIARRYIQFPKYQLPSTFLSKISDQIPILFIASLYGGEIVGLYGIAVAIVSIPVNLIGTSVGDVFYGESASIGRKDPKKISELSNSIFRKLVLIGLIPLIVLIIFAPLLFSFVFGNNWYPAGEYASILAILSYAQLIFQPVSRIYTVFERQKPVLIITIIRIILVFSVFGISKVTNLTFKIAIALYVLVMVLVFGITYLYAQMIIKEEIKSINVKK